MIPSPSCFLFLAFVFPAVTNLSTTTTALEFQRVTDEERFKECNQGFTCKSTGSQPPKFKYPFWGGDDEMPHCGLPEFKLSCRENYNVIEIVKEKIAILEIKRDEQIVTVVRTDMLDDGCPDHRFTNTTVHNKNFERAPYNEKLTFLYGCSPSNISSRQVPQEDGFTCTPYGPNKTVPGLYTMETPHQTNQTCNSTTDIPVRPKYHQDLKSNKMAAKDVVKEGFDLKYKFDTMEACSECLRSGGQCGCNEVSMEFVCFYKDPLFVVLLLTRLMLFSLAKQQGHNESCGGPYMCGNLGEIFYPFKSSSRLPAECGLYTVNCSDPNNPKVQLKEGGHWFGVDLIDWPGFITIHDATLQKNLKSGRCESLESFGLPRPDWFSNVSSPKIVSLFKCKRSSLHNITSPTSDFQYSTACGDYNLYYSTPTKQLLDNSSFPDFPQDNCSFIQLPAAGHTANPNDFFSFFTDTFSLEAIINYDCLPCLDEKYRCLYDDRTHSHRCAHKGDGDSLKWKLGVGIAALPTGLLVLVVCVMRRCSSNEHIFFWRKPNLAQQNVEAYLKIHGPLPTRKYGYLDVKKMTNSFANKIGQGGYGSVYKGKLQNGCPVAVKVLNRSKGNGEEFINEVATISRTSHVNIVALLGFCVEGSKRVLIYEFMCNGSLEKFIFKENHHYRKENHQLEWGTLYLISLGVARGLEYLHRGCNTRILHFDIKPHNILLDENFSPKISDFGLAKVCTREESIISMLEARGTIGYIAPEVFCRSFGEVSYKSDVYSYGLMILEMVGGRKNVNAGADHTSEIYFPHWIYKRLELDDELGLKGIRNQEDNAKVRKMVTTGLWCIQTDPSNRPTMSKVIEMLEGSDDSIQVPPKPFLSSPSRSERDSSTSLVQACSHGSNVANI